MTEKKKFCEICADKGETVEAMGDYCMGEAKGFPRVNVCTVHFCQTITAGINDTRDFREEARKLEKVREFTARYGNKKPLTRTKRAT